MKIFDGNAHAKLLEERIKHFLSLNPGRMGENASKLGIIQVGESTASKTYVRLKRDFCASLGVPVEVLILDSSLQDGEIISAVRDFLGRVDISGAIIQLPLPRASLDPLLGLIPVEKDVDLLSPESKRRFYGGDFSRLPPTVRAFDYFLEQTELDQEHSLSVGIIGYGDLVGMPLAHFCTLSGLRVGAVGFYDNQKLCDYQVLVLSAGLPNLVDPGNVAPGTSVVDFGYSRVGDRTVGDLDMSKNMDHLGVVSPSVGGMGPLVIRFLVMNFLGI